MMLSDKHVHYGEVLSDPKSVSSFMESVIASFVSEGDNHKEHLFVIGLTTINTVQYVECVSIGSIDACIVSIPDVFRVAILKKVPRIICAHNHPSGGTEPSGGDIAITQKLVNAGNILSIRVMDHVIIGEGCTSIFELYPDFRYIK